MPDRATTGSTGTGRSTVTEAITHPVRLRIIQQLGGRTLTTTQLRQALPDVKQATLYRHISALLEAELLAVVEERKVRGAIERTLALGEQMAHIDHDGLRAMSDAQLRESFVVFLGELAADFDRMLERGAPDLREMLGFGRGAVYVDTEDLTRIQQGFAELLAPYQEDRGEAKRRLTLATVLLPEVGA